LNTSCHTFEYVMSHVWICHVIHLNTSCHTFEYVVSYTWIRRVIHLNTSCHTFEYVVSYIWIRRVTHLNTSCHTFEYVVSYIWIRHVTRLNLSRYTCARLAAHTRTLTHTHTFTYTHTRTYTQLCLTTRRTAFSISPLSVNALWCVAECCRVLQCVAVCVAVRRTTFSIIMIGLIHTRDMTHEYMFHVTSLMETCDMAGLTCARSLMHTCLSLRLLYVASYSFKVPLHFVASLKKILSRYLLVTHEHVLSRHGHSWIYVSHHVTRGYVWHMRWLRIVGSLQLYFSFAEYSLFYRALLQKRPILLRSLLIVATP